MQTVERISLPLACDLGSNDGADTAYLLEKGFRVLAVDADPSLAAAVSEAFSEAVHEQRLVVLNAAVSSQAGATDFFVSGASTHWSSCVEDKARFGGSAVTRISVPTIAWAAIVAGYGEPVLVKADIEGNEVDLLDQMMSARPAKLPYLALELSKDNYAAIFERAVSLGYAECKLVNQIHAMGERMIRHLDGRRTVRSFPKGSSGPMHDDLDGANWVALTEGRRRYDLFRELRDLDARELTPGWLDLHLRSPDAEDAGG
ncbi:MAG: FkbM family methyltransferase [Polyangiaceae bacterium]|jgi:FkbM family methyltransferase